MMPELEPKPKAPHTSINLGGDYLLLGLRDSIQKVQDIEAVTIHNYYQSNGVALFADTPILLARWARL
jgi:hypothetical protein